MWFLGKTLGPWPVHLPVFSVSDVRLFPSYLYAYQVIVGTVIIAAVSLDMLQKRRRQRVTGTRSIFSIGGLRTG
jgi:hypothetical protein